MLMFVIEECLSRRRRSWVESRSSDFRRVSPRVLPVEISAQCRRRVPESVGWIRTSWNCILCQLFAGDRVIRWLCRGVAIYNVCFRGLLFAGSVRVCCGCSRIIHRNVDLLRVRVCISLYCVPSKIATKDKTEPITGFKTVKKYDTESFL